MRSQFICLALAIVLPSPHASGQWVQTNGPYGGTVRCFAVSGENLFAGAYGVGVFVSTNNGSSWTEVDAGLTNTFIGCLATSPDLSGNLFVGTEGGEVFFPLTTAQAGLPSTRG